MGITPASFNAGQMIGWAARSKIKWKPPSPIGSARAIKTDVVNLVGRSLVLLRYEDRG